MKRILTAALVVALLGAACDQTPDPIVPKRETAETAALMTLSTAVGALQRCRVKAFYVGEPDIVNDSFYRLAGVMRERFAAGDEKVPVETERLYRQSLSDGSLSIFSINKSGKIVSASVAAMKDEGTCKAAEMILINARKSGEILDRKPVAELK